jgi:phosphoribosylformylglycinamidine synthase
MKLASDVIEQHGLTEAEYAKIVKRLDRDPNLTELGIFSVMWSEHCSYKSSRVHLRRLPTKGACVIQGPGENAGVVDIGSGLAIVFKIESHNHPSFIEPYQGAATGVGGIIRDIFTMGARPIASMDALHFGPLDVAKNRAIMEGVVAGVGGYGNAIGIPTVGGETIFADGYSNNPIVNVFCLGLAKKERIFYGRARGVGNLVIYVGAKTGRDGIHGATMASAEFGEESQAKRPNVQIGDPFLEKLLVEACLEAMKAGVVVGIQDMGAAGLTSSSCEMGARAGTGVEIDLQKVPQREAGMTAYEIMLSESQERMLLVTEPDKAGQVLEIFNRWGLDAVVIGRVTGDGLLRVKNGERVEAEIPNEALVHEAPVYERPKQRPSYLDRVNDLVLADIPLPSDLSAVLLRMLSSPNLADKRWIYEQYDYMVRTNTIVLPGSDAAVLRVKKTEKALAMTLDGNPRYTYLNPRAGAMIAVAESCRNLVCSGATPLAATNCLNFGNPENPEVMWQFSEVIDGLADACRFFNTPITGGNVSFYNETLGKGIYPTPVIGMVGLMEDQRRAMTFFFKDAGDVIVLLGETFEELGGSEYIEQMHGVKKGPLPVLNLEKELAVQNACREAIAQGIIKSAHDSSEGGLAVALAESCLARKEPIGCDIELTSAMRPDALLFGETQSRIIVSLKASDVDRLSAIASKYQAPWTRLGTVTGTQFRIAINNTSIISLAVSDMKDAWASAIERRMFA